MNTARKKPSATRGRPFGKDNPGKPFKKGNPGRPKGSRNKAILAMESLLDGEANKLTRKAVELALEGDTVALRLCLDRICPPRKDRPIKVELPNVESTDQVTAAQARIVAAAASGEITPGEAESFAKLLEGQRRTIELAELDRRISELEAQGGRNA